MNYLTFCSDIFHFTFPCNPVWPEMCREWNRSNWGAFSGLILFDHSVVASGITASGILGRKEGRVAFHFHSNRMEEEATKCTMRPGGNWLQEEFSSISSDGGPKLSTTFNREFCWKCWADFWAKKSHCIESNLNWQPKPPWFPLVCTGLGVSSRTYRFRLFLSELLLCLPHSAWAGGNLAEWADRLGSNGGNNQFWVNKR